MFSPALFSDLKLMSTLTVERNSEQLETESVHSQRKTTTTTTKISCLLQLIHKRNQLLQTTIHINLNQNGLLKVQLKRE